jgi:dTDP-glucose pyrophosphorylase
MATEIDAFLTNTGLGLKDAMRQMEGAARRILFVVDEEGVLLGSLSDGDIRRWILEVGSLNGTVADIYNSHPVFATPDWSRERLRQTMLEDRIESIPVVDEHQRIVKVLFWEDVFGESTVFVRKKLGMPVVIMAGGMGVRLDPFTRILPKPLIPIGNRTVIEIIMDKFGQYHADKFYISINHKGKMIKSYLEEADQRYDIEYIEEKSPLGTAGCLRYLQERIADSMIVSNCDIIVDCDYSELVAFHENHKNDISIVGSFRRIIIPYGICEIENGGTLTRITEKPEYDFLVNTGMYILRKNTLGLIPEGQVFHVTDLINAVKSKGGKVGVFPVGEKSWLDVGQWEEYRKSVKQLGSDW